VRPAPATLHISADDRFTAYLNGVRVGSHHDWHTPQRYDVTRDLHAGENVLAIEAENVAANVPKNPAGLICCLQVTISTANVIEIRSDATWRCSKKESNGWELPAFDDREWTSAKVAAKYGQPPWGVLQGDPPPAVFAAGIPEKVRVIYVSQRVPIRVKGLEANLRYHARRFDPINGTETDLGPVTPDINGEWASPAPPAGMDDWVLVLERG
jgi:hypothetical protein